MTVISSRQQIKMIPDVERQGFTAFETGIGASRGGEETDLLSCLRRVSETEKERKSREWEKLRWSSLREEGE